VVAGSRWRGTIISMSSSAPIAAQAFTQRHAPGWQAVWRDLGALPEPGLLPRLLGCYTEVHRHYHTLEHLDACLEQLALAQSLAAHRGEVALALWFHDAVYAIAAADNEHKSADWARDALRRAGVAEVVAQRVHALVMVTCHSVAPTTNDEKLLLDIALSILGMPASRFARYERQVRSEYRQVPEAQFRDRRINILQQFLARPHIYHTIDFRDRLEAQARANLQRSIDRLRAKLSPGPDGPTGC